MKRFYSYSLLCIGLWLCPNLCFGDIPANSQIYLDVSQHWCCAGSYGLFLSRDSKTYIMNAVPGYTGLYLFETTTSIQDNLRFGYYSDVKSGTQNGQPTTHTDDVKGWSSSKKYFVVDDESGKGHWASEPVAPQSTTELYDIKVDFVNMSCVDSTYTVRIEVTFGGVPCSMLIQSDLIETSSKQRKVVTPKSPYVLDIPVTHEDAGTKHVVRVGIYADRDATDLIGDKKTVEVVAPEFTCREEHDQMEICLGEKVTLTAPDGGEEYVWSTGENTQTIDVTPTSVGLTKYTVETYSSTLSVKNNLMANGDFEEQFVGEPKIFSSDYTYQGFDPMNIYAGDGKKNGVYVITSSAKRVAGSYADVYPHSGDYFALFDADESGRAWYTNSTQNPQLKIQKDSFYVFSYWMANVNTSKESGHPARLQFQITYGGQTYDLGAQYPAEDETLEDNEWHYREEVYQAKADADNVEISVKDMTTYKGVGNDFGLDDIMFQQTTESRMRLAKTDIFHIMTIDCGDNPCPKVITTQFDTIVCDLDLPLTWRGREFTKEETQSVMVKSDRGCDSLQFVYSLSTKTCLPPSPDECVDNLVYRKWGDVLVVNNGQLLGGLNGHAVSYQWFRNDMPIDGATEQVYYNPQDMSGEFYVEFVLDNGIKIRTCSYSFRDMPSSAETFGNSGQRPIERQEVYSVTPTLRVVRIIHEDGTTTVTKYLQIY